MKVYNIISHKKGESLVELVIATAVFVVVASAIMGVMTSSGRITEKNAQMRVNYENVVGIMDCYLNNADPALGTDYEVNIDFNATGNNKTVECVKIYEADLSADLLAGADTENMVSVGIVKKK